jgi:hypothetical protein
MCSACWWKRLFHTVKWLATELCIRVLALSLIQLKEMWLTTRPMKLRAPVLLDAGTVEVGSSVSHQVSWWGDREM